MAGRGRLHAAFPTRVVSKLRSALARSSLHEYKDTEYGALPRKVTAKYEFFVVIVRLP